MLDTWFTWYLLPRVLIREYRQVVKKMTIPPVIERTVPEANSTMYEGNTVSLTFDEFIVTDEILSTLIVSPPIEDRPVLKSRSKTLIIELGDELRPNTTYSLDFKDAIQDNNEKNPLENFRFAFSTGVTLDTLAIGGYVRNAEDMEPMEGTLVLLHKDDGLGLFRENEPDYIAKTDEDGFFAITNIAPGSYSLYAIEDADNSLTFSQASEKIAFSDSPIVLSGIPLDTTQMEEPHYLSLFMEDHFNQYLAGYGRDQANRCHFYFAESLTDSFQVEMLSPETTSDWSYFEFNQTRDSLLLWVNDTVISNTDTLKFQLSYQVQDSLENMITRMDTLDLFFSKAEKKESRKKKDEEEVEIIQPFAFSTNIKNNFDINKKLKIEAAEPLESIDLSMFHLSQVIDTIVQDVPFDIVQDSLSSYKYYIDYPWESEETYKFIIDSAAAYTYSEQPSDKVDKNFTIQKEGYYAKIFMTLSNLPGSCILQIFKR